MRSFNAARMSPAFRLPPLRLRSTNRKKIQFTQRLPLGSELHMGKERCCLRGLDHLHGPTFHSICGNLMIYKPSVTIGSSLSSHSPSMNHSVVFVRPALFCQSINLLAILHGKGKLEHFLHRKNREHINFWLSMFPEKRYFRETTSTTEVLSLIHI